MSMTCVLDKKQIAYLHKRKEAGERWEVKLRNRLGSKKGRKLGLLL